MGADEDDAGFTLIELLTVFAVVGILAALALPAMLDQRVKAAHTAAASDLRGVRHAQALWLAEDNDGYTADVADLVAVGYRQSEGVSLPALKLVGSEYLACVRHTTMSDWLVFSSGSGQMSRSATNACA